MDFAEIEQRKPSYLAINPKGRVPALVTENGTLTETPALLAYVAQRFPAAKLAPLDDPFAFARVQEFNSYLCSTAHVAHAHLRRGARWVDAANTAAIEAMTRYVPVGMTQIFELIDGRMLKGPWVLGEAYSICDPYLYTLSTWLEGDDVDLDRIPNVRDHRAAWPRATASSAHAPRKVCRGDHFAAWASARCADSALLFYLCGFAARATGLIAATFAAERVTHP